ncbi:hypothetical protein EBU91_04160 [bacterium]|nr:hypothetical protein [bacterium]
MSPNEIIGSPVVVGNRVYVAIGQDPVHGPGRGALSCITVDGAEDGAEARCLWRYTGIGRALSTVAVDDGLVYAAEYAGKLHCLDADSGELVWFHDTQDEIWSSPFVVDGKVYIGGRTSFTVLSTWLPWPTERPSSRQPKSMLPHACAIASASRMLGPVTSWPPREYE